MVGLRVGLGAPLTGLNSPAVLVLLTVQLRRPTVFLRCMSMLFHTVLVIFLPVFLVVFSSMESNFSFAPSLISLTYHPFPGSPVPFDFAGVLFNHIFVFSLSSLSPTNYFLLFHHFFIFEFFISYKLIIVLVIDLSVLCQLHIYYHFSDKTACSVLCPVLFLFGVRLGSLPLVVVAGSCVGCVQ
jgi:hypothetical protein